MKALEKSGVVHSNLLLLWFFKKEENIRIWLLLILKIKDVMVPSSDSGRILFIKNTRWFMKNFMIKMLKFIFLQ